MKIRNQTMLVTTLALAGAMSACATQATEDLKAVRARGNP